MARIDPFKGKRPQRIVETKAFKDSLNPGELLDLTLKGLDTTESYYVFDVVTELTERYITGNEITGVPPVELPYIDGEPIRVSKTLLNSVAYLVVMQQEREDKAPVYSEADFIYMSVTWPNAFAEINKWARDLNKRADANAGNAFGADMQTNCDPPSDSISSTPK